MHAVSRSVKGRARVKVRNVGFMMFFRFGVPECEWLELNVSVLVEHA